MKAKDLTLGLRVQITKGHWQDRTGIVLAIGAKTILIDIGEPLLISELPEHLEPAPPDPLPLGCEEVDI